ncbi:hypothetical protein SLEP1_g9127 [Rubroshorea leprosula]|uniref:PB1-like domain-containing protein n=1 Tax=Rubroshorea leprosula TaxID=152421 RepID=A0AAV5IEX5_9ROSI|nr:hypothetical protein SLEP1_g9127 [Rubroshorea leprosula]
MSNDPPFKICIHFDSRFDINHSRYTGGETYDLLVWDIDKLCYWDIVDKLGELGYGSFKVLYYRIFNFSLAESMVQGFHSLNGDAEIIEVAKILIQSTVCHVFVEHYLAAIDGDLVVRNAKLSRRDGTRNTMLDDNALGSDANDEELLAGISKHAVMMGVNEGPSNLNVIQRKDKGKQKVAKENHKAKNRVVGSTSTSKGIRISELNSVDENGLRLVDNSDFEDDETNSSCSSSTYINSSDPGSFYSDSSIEDPNAKDDALRRPSSSLHYDPNCDSPHFEGGKGLHVM